MQLPLFFELNATLIDFKVAFRKKFEVTKKMLFLTLFFLHIKIDYDKIKK